MNREYKEKLSRKIEKNFSDLEMRIMEDIVRRIRMGSKITSTADWQINRRLILGNSSEDIEKMLKEALDASYPKMFELYDQVIDWEYVRNKEVYEQVNQRFIPYDENIELQELAEGWIRQTKGELENITQSLGFYLDYGNGKRVMTPLAQIYQGYLDAAVMDVVTGAFDYNSVLRRTVTQLTNSGLRTIDYASGRSNRVDVAARRAVMTGITQLSGQIADIHAEKLGTDYFEVEWHAGARPTHQVWQGRVYSREELVTVCHLGEITGLEGVNCYHTRFPFFPGISVRNWTDEWLEEKNQEENTPKEFHGKEYTLYEAKQRQRQMETAMRAQRQKVKLLQKGGADPDEVMLARCKYQGQLNEYARFSKKMGLKEERERIYYDMQGRVAPRTAYIKLSDTTDKWAREAKRELLRDEETLSDRKKEIAVVYDEKGNYLFTKRGNGKSVYFTKRELKRMKGKILSHNHPSGGAFSIADWILFNETKLQEIRVTTTNGVYYLRRTEAFEKLNINSEELEREFKKVREEIKKQYQDLYESGTISKTERFLRSSENYNRIFAKQMGLEFGRERFDE